MGYNIVFYEDLDNLNSYIKSEVYADDLCLGITVNEYESGSYSYSLSFNATDNFIPS